MDTTAMEVNAEAACKTKIVWIWLDKTYFWKKKKSNFKLYQSSGTTQTHQDQALMPGSFKDQSKSMAPWMGGRSKGRKVKKKGIYELLTAMGGFYPAKPFVASVDSS